MASEKTRRISVHVDEATGKQYTYDEETGETEWLNPPDLPKGAPPKARRVSFHTDEESGKQYTYDEDTGETAWVGDDNRTPVATAGVELAMVSVREVARGGLARGGPEGGPIGVRSGPAPGTSLLDEVKLLDEKFKKPIRGEIFVTDTHIHGKLQKSRCCCCCKCTFWHEWEMDLDAIAMVHTSQPKDAGCIGLARLYTIWFLIGIFGGHYWVYKRKWARTRTGKAFLFFYFITGGLCGLLWLRDAFRIWKWLGNYHITIFTMDPWAENWSLDLQDGALVHRIRDALYQAMAPSRQINPNAKAQTISKLSTTDQLKNAPGARKVSGFGFTSGKTYMAVTSDRLLIRRHNPQGCCGDIHNEWEDVFVQDVVGMEQTQTLEYPTWYAWVWWMPPWGLFGCHRAMLGQKPGCALWIYQFTLGYFGIGWLLDSCTMCCCIAKLRTKAELRIALRSVDADFGLKLGKPEDGDTFRGAIKTELLRNPRVSPDRAKHEYRVVQMDCAFECFKRCEKFTENVTAVDRITVSVTRTTKSKPKRAIIPCSPCCPICWLPCIRCCVPKIRTVDIEKQEVCHGQGTKSTSVFYESNSDIDSMLKIWALTGLCGGHFFKARWNKMALKRVSMWVAFIGIVGFWVGDELWRQMYTSSFDGARRLQQAPPAGVNVTSPVASNAALRGDKTRGLDVQGWARETFATQKTQRRLGVNTGSSSCEYDDAKVCSLSAGVVSCKAGTTCKSSYSYGEVRCGSAVNDADNCFGDVVQKDTDRSSFDYGCCDKACGEGSLKKAECSASSGIFTETCTCSFSDWDTDYGKCNSFDMDKTTTVRNNAFVKIGSTTCKHSGCECSRYRLGDGSCDYDCNNEKCTWDYGDCGYNSLGVYTRNRYATVIGNAMYVAIAIVAFWISDLFWLRRLLNTTQVELAGATNAFQAQLWNAPWQCQLNNEAEAKEVIQLLHKFNHSLKKKQ